ncbi:hypothetical protein [Nitrosomonas supralitoralis]|uniref:hypothetical protein n=1 Tax=Nitrosomonas supralitoralis TaxID=2116706 RepID=UPI0015586550|nr:hypothetical protein [Nitrosomonas supralitoralis]
MELVHYATSALSKRMNLALIQLSLFDVSLLAGIATGNAGIEQIDSIAKKPLQPNYSM